MGKKTTSTKGTGSASRATRSQTSASRPGHPRSPRTSAANDEMASQPKAARRATSPSSSTVAKPRASAGRATGARTSQRSAKSGGNGRRIDTEQIAIRAYYIAERRRSQGLAGDPTEDWINAERELMAEIH